MSEHIPYRRFRFGLRTLFVFLTIAGLFSGWLGYHLKWIRDRHNAAAWIEANKPSFENCVLAVERPFPVSLWILGETPNDSITVTTDDETGLDRLRELFPEALVINQKPFRPLTFSNPTH